MKKEREDRIIGVITLFVTLVFTMVGVYIILISRSWAGWTVGAWVGGIFLFFLPRTSLFLDNAYRHCPDKRRVLGTFIVFSGAIVAIIASGMEMEVVISPIRMTLCCWGVCWGVSGAYLLLHRETYFFGD